MGITARLGAVLLSCVCLLPFDGRAQTAAKYVHTDALGSVVAMTDSTGAVIETTREYEPYGLQLTPIIEDGPGYTGHVQDAATGLTYMQQRYYDPGIGRFLSADPITVLDNGDMRHFNRFAYAYNNPYRFTDPDGRCPMCAGAFVGLVLEVVVQSVEIASGQRDSFDGGDIFISTAAGAVGVGLAQNISRVGRLGNAGMVAANAAADGAVSAGSQFAKHGEVSLQDTAVDIVGGATVGRIAGDAAASRAAASAQGRQLERTADRAERVAGGSSNPRQSRVDAAAQARGQQQNFVQGRAAAAGASAANATSAAVNSVTPEKRDP